ncbi:hypothetical protein C4G64_RS11795 [Vibrio parahaemolyticus O1]|nr:hypothetical protein [Vibrio parahaemolyticus O1]MBM4882823.1 hypothetical protein [Vibrio parahaemolyticus]HAS6892592.1 hypothetical protein [Vibrio parahaemolyticus]
MSLYPQILFHFTNKDGLESLLRDDFKVSYAREKIEGKNQTKEFGVPMVSFCDLRLSELKHHMTKYGKFGIGLSKDWANEKGLNPVWYVNRSSDFADNFSSALGGIYRHLDEIKDPESHKGLSEEYMKVVDTYRYIKNYEGKLTREGKIYPNFRFADEREWRYIPPLNESDVLPFVPISRIRTKANKKEYNEKIKHLRLTFEPKDIQYLVVESEQDIMDLINLLQEAKGRRFSYEEIKRLSSRILTSEQIENDI